MYLLSFAVESKRNCFGVSSFSIKNIIRKYCRRWHATKFSNVVPEINFQPLTSFHRLSENLTWCFSSCNTFPENLTSFVLAGLSKLQRKRFFNHNRGEGSSKILERIGACAEELKLSEIQFPITSPCFESFDYSPGAVLLALLIK